MEQIFLRFTIRTMLCIVFLFALFFFVATKSWQIHDAVKVVQAAGGDVWCSGNVYPEVVAVDRSQIPASELLQRALITSQILMGSQTQLWVSTIKEDHDEITHHIAVLNPNVIRFEVLGQNDFNRIRQLFPSVEISSSCGASRQESKGKVTEANSLRSTRERTSPFNAMERLLSEDPELTYRLDRYDTIIGYHEDGAMGSLYDKQTGRVITLQWPD